MVRFICFLLFCLSAEAFRGVALADENPVRQSFRVTVPTQVSVRLLSSHVMAVSSTSDVSIRIATPDREQTHAIAAGRRVMIPVQWSTLSDESTASAWPVLTISGL